MKCPKCGYISFDYNEVCPKCNKNIAALRDKMSLPAYKAAPLSMLKSLTREGSDSDSDISVQVSEDTASVLEEEEGLSLEDSQAIEAMEKTFKDSQEFDIQLETTLDEVWDEAPKADESDLSLDIEDLPVEGHPDRAVLVAVFRQADPHGRLRPQGPLGITVQADEVHAHLGHL